MFDKILVAYHDSTGARRALEIGVDMAQRPGVALVAVVVEAHLPHYAATVGEVEEDGAKLLILGHSGHSAIWGRFLGSTVEKVSRHAKCSVLIAAPPEGRT
jgi:nucleotide-binding universal stress UspA family protein